MDGDGVLKQDPDLPRVAHYNPPRCNRLRVSGLIDQNTVLVLCERDTE